MTFSVVVMEENRPKVVGTVWASDESAAQALAPAVFPAGQSSHVSLRRAEERELPLRICETSRVPSFW